MGPAGGRGQVSRGVVSVVTSRNGAGSMRPRSREFIHKEEARPTGRPRGEPGGSAVGTGRGHPRHRDTPSARGVRVIPP